MTLKEPASMYFNLPDGCDAGQTVTIFHLMFQNLRNQSYPCDLTVINILN